MAFTFVSAAAVLVVGTYHLIASIPFAYYNFLHIAHFAWLPWFERLHPWIFFAGALGLATPRSDAPQVKTWRRRLLTAVCAVTACMAVAQSVPVVQSFELSTALSFTSWGVLVGGCVLTFAARGGLVRHDGAAPSAGRAVADAAVAGLAVACLYIAHATFVESAASSLRSGDLGVAVLLSAAIHLVTFAAGALLIAGAAAAARGGTHPERAALATIAASIAVSAVVVRRVLLTALDLDEWIAVPVALAMAAACVLLWTAVDTGRGARRSPARSAASAVAIALGLVVLPPVLRFADWGFTIQKLLALSVWIATMTLMAALSSRARRAVALVAAGVAIAGIATTTVKGAGVRQPAALHRFDPRLALDQYTTFDPSLRAMLDIVRPMMTDRQYFNTLRRVGEATSERRDPIAPLPLTAGAAVLADRPDIFIIVVDSLRPDYLSPYNPAVTFTPSIAAFAKESVVLPRVYTPYAGTGLAEAAIWTGGLIPRLQYPKPFAPLDNLTRLAVAGGYRRYLSIDTIVDPILDDRRDVTQLDSHIKHPDRREEMMRYDICATLDELTARLDRDTPAAPVMLFTQPQNVHIRAIDTGGPHLWIKRPDPETLFAPATKAIEKIDGCFGRFIAYLKAAGRYDNSIVVLTADHGDSYGEEGRWGHAFYVAPETLRIPLLMHVPQRLMARRTWNANAVAWLIDIVPSIYELVGARPLYYPGISGRSLFARDGEAFPPREPIHLIQSSYSRLYGLIDDEATWMYVADANRDRRQYYDLTAPGVAAVPLADADRIRYEGLLMQALNRLNAQYAPDFRP